MFWQIVGADAIWAVIDTALIAIVLLAVHLWRRRRRPPPGEMGSSSDLYCRHCARCEACITPGKLHADCTRGPFYCGVCSRYLHGLTIPPERPE